MSFSIHKDFTHGFWFWQNKLEGILAMLALLADYKLDDVEPGVIRQGLIGTNDALDKWFEWRFHGKKHIISLRFAYDEQEGPDMILIQIKTDSALREKLEALNTFQCLFTDWQLERP